MCPGPHVEGNVGPLIDERLNGETDSRLLLATGTRYRVKDPNFSDLLRPTPFCDRFSPWRLWPREFLCHSGVASESLHDSQTVFVLQRALHPTAAGIRRRNSENPKTDKYQ
jgi:hypothetical protein